MNPDNESQAAQWPEQPETNVNSTKSLGNPEWPEIDARILRQVADYAEEFNAEVRKPGIYTVNLNVCDLPHGSIILASRLENQIDFLQAALEYSEVAHHTDTGQQYQKEGCHKLAAQLARRNLPWRAWQIVRLLEHMSSLRYYGMNNLGNLRSVTKALADPATFEVCRPALEQLTRACGVWSEASYTRKFAQRLAEILAAGGRR